jgi:hypothetical protein
MDSNLRFPDRSAPVFETGVPFPWRFKWHDQEPRVRAVGYSRLMGTDEEKARCGGLTQLDRWFRR